MNNSFETKAGLKFKTTYKTTISTADITSYLENDVLQLPIDTKFFPLIGATGGYVILALTLNEKDFAVSSRPTGYAERELLKYDGYSKTYKKDIDDKLKPFFMPNAEQIDLLTRDPEYCKLLSNIGLWGANLKTVQTFSNYRYSPETGYHVIFLDVEKIIAQMAEDPLTNKIEGTFTIDKINVDKDIRWDISITRGNVRRNSSISIDDVIRTAR